MDSLAVDLNAILGVLALILGALAWIGGMIWKASIGVERVLSRLELHDVIAQDHENRLRVLEKRPPGKILNFTKQQ